MWCTSPTVCRISKGACETQRSNLVHALVRAISQLQRRSRATGLPTAESALLYLFRVISQTALLTHCHRKRKHTFIFILPGKPRGRRRRSETDDEEYCCVLPSPPSVCSVRLVSVQIVPTAGRSETIKVVQQGMALLLLAVSPNLASHILSMGFRSRTLHSCTLEPVTAQGAVLAHDLAGLLCFPCSIVLFFRSTWESSTLCREPSPESRMSTRLLVTCAAG